MKKVDLDKLEDVQVKVDKDAFAPTSLACCNKKMSKSNIEINLDNDVSIKIKGFECKNCNKRYLSLHESKKLDRAMIVSRVMSKDFKMKRNLSFDGDNYTFRIPKEFTHDLHKKKIEIVPLGAKEFCATID